MTSSHSIQHTTIQTLSFSPLKSIKHPILSPLRINRNHIYKDESTQTKLICIDNISRSQSLAHSLSECRIAKDVRKKELPKIRKYERGEFLFGNKDLRMIDNEIANVMKNTFVVKHKEKVWEKKKGDVFELKEVEFKPLQKLGFGFLNPVEKGRFRKFIVNFSKIGMVGRIRRDKGKDEGRINEKRWKGDGCI